MNLCTTQSAQYFYAANSINIPYVYVSVQYNQLMSSDTALRIG